MARSIIIMIDIHEIGLEYPETNQIIFTDDPGRIDRYIRDLSDRWPNTTICVYRLTDLQKLKTLPQYARYKVDPNTGEIIPQ